MIYIHLICVACKLLSAGIERSKEGDAIPGGGGGVTLGISGWGGAAGTLETLTYTRASSAEFCYPILNSPNHSYPRLAVFQKPIFDS